MPLLADAEALRETVDRMAEWGTGRRPDVVVGGEACGFVPARRPGKLPLETVTAEYALEYGTNVLELQRDAIAGGTRVLIHDDVLATGGTARAMADLVEQLGGTVVGLAFLIELTFLNGRERIREYDVLSLIQY
jgi:adenine phosphoribosyltransferase